MNILMLTPRLPFPPNRGDKIRSFAQLRYLARRHNLWCATLLEPDDDPYALPLLRHYCADLATIPVAGRARLARALTATAAGRTFTEGYFASAPLERLLDSWTKKVHFDAVLAFSGAMAPYAAAVPAARKILDLVDADSAKWDQYAACAHWPMRSVYRTEARRLHNRQLDWLNVFDATIVINSRESAVLTTQTRCPRLHVIPNGIELPADPPPVDQTDPIVGFVGVMSYPPNVDAVLWFTDSVWPTVRRSLPHARLVIVGARPTRKVRRLARLPGVTVTGSVPSTQPYLADFRVCIAPLRIARGLQNKMLEALAAGRPIVATTQAAAGIEPCPAPGVLLADQSEPFAQQLLKLLHQPELARQLGREGRIFVTERYRWDDHLARLEQLLAGTTAEAPVAAQSPTAARRTSPHQHLPAHRPPSAGVKTLLKTSAHPPARPGQDRPG